jgi:hypothetical protein
MRLVLACALLAVGCQSTGSGDGDAVTDAGGEEAEPTLALPFDVQVDGEGTVRVGPVVMDSPAGVAGVHDVELPVLAYQITDWTAYGYTLFHVVAPQGSTLNVMYLYCTDAGLEWIWHEDWDAAMDVETGTGSCSWTTTSTELDMPALRALTARPSAAQLEEGFVLSGPDVVYEAGPGTLVWEGETMDLYPFEVVDCSTECTADPADGWWELHSMLVGPESGTCFAILYLMVADADSVQLGYPVCFDPVRVRPDVVLSASWASPERMRGTAPPGPRPVHLGHVLRPQPPFVR